MSLALNFQELHNLTGFFGLLRSKICISSPKFGAMSTRFTRGGSSRGNPSTTPPQIVPIDVDSLDDDVIISSPRSFAEAKNNSRRNRGETVVDLDAESSSSGFNNTNRSDRIPANQPVINCESYDYVNLRSLFTSLRERNARHQEQAAPPAPPPPRFRRQEQAAPPPPRTRRQEQAASPPPPPPPPPPPQEPAFSCPICMGPLVEEMTTKCGHIFCKSCITAAIAAQRKCPTCRRKLTTKDILRVFLPSTRS